MYYKFNRRETITEMKHLLIGLFLTLIGQILIFFQTNGQFFIPWFKRHPIIVSIVFGSTVSYIFINGTQQMVTYFGGHIWESRLLGFGMGMVTFGLLTNFFMGEGMNTKTIVSLTLALSVVLIQVLWK